MDLEYKDIESVFICYDEREVNMHISIGCVLLSVSAFNDDIPGHDFKYCLGFPKHLVKYTHNKN